jgi:hypothetical protein
MTDVPQDDRLTNRLLRFVDQHRRFVFAVIVLVYLAGFNGQWRVNSDSALYAAIAKNLATGHGYTYLGQLDRIVEPGLPWTIALGFHLFGVGNFVLPTLVILAAALGSLALVHQLFRLHAGRPTAVMVVLLTALADRVYTLAFELFTDMPFFFGVMLTLVGYERLVRDDGDHAVTRDTRRPWPWVAVTAGLLVMNVYRATALTFMGALAVAIVWHLLRRRQVRRHLIMGGIMVAVVLGLRLIDPRRQHVDQPIVREALLGSLLTDRLAWALHRTFFDFLPMLTGETAIEAVLSFRIAPGINHLFSLGVVAIGLWLAMRRRVLWGLWVLATLAQMLVWLPRERYFLPILPLLLYGIWSALAWANHRWPVRRTNVVVALALVLLLVPNLVKVVRHVVMQRRTPFYEHLAKGRVLRVMEAAKQINAVARPDDLIIADDDRELSYFSDRRVIAPVFSRRIPPSPREMDAYRAQLAAAPRLLIVLPGEQTQRVIEAFNLRVGEPLFDRNGLVVHPAAVPENPNP